MRTALFFGIALSLAACTAVPEDPGPESALPTAADLVGTVWIDTCSDTVYWIRFQEDGTYDYSTSGPSGWDNDGTDTWTLEGPVLTISWTDGYRVATFDLSGGLERRIDGQSAETCDGIVHLERQS